MRPQVGTVVLMLTNSCHAGNLAIVGCTNSCTTPLHHSPSRKLRFSEPAQVLCADEKFQHEGHCIAFTLHINKMQGL